MPLSPLGRKVLLPFGKQREIARRLNVSTALVSGVVNGVYNPRTPRGQKTARRVQVAVSRALGMKLSEAFAESAPQSVQHRPSHYVT